MTTTIEATFDGEVFRPTQPVSLEPNTPVKLTVETAEPSPAQQDAGVKHKKPYSFFDVARSLKIEDGPPDWSANIDKYLYGEHLHGEDAGREE
jgi:AF2212-like protein